MNIGLTQRVLYHKNRAYDSIEHEWYSYLKEHTLTFIPNRLDQDFEEIANNLDALIITGGDDSALRRTVELKLASHMLIEIKPIIGICHGAFLLTDVMDGVVIPTFGHMDTEHDIEYFGDNIKVNSFHQLAIKQAPKNATILCRDGSGNIEAWIEKKIAAVVWHPERMETPWLPDEIQGLLK
jgi:putative glutamine amidotransferase